MSWVSWVLFESPIALGAVGFVACFWLLVWWRRGGSVWPLLTGLALMLAAFGLQAAVETHREVARRVMAVLEADVQAGAVRGMHRVLDPDFQSDQMTRPEFIEFAERTLKRVRVEWVRNTAITVLSAERDRFSARSIYLSEVNADAYRGVIKSAWRLEFARRGRNWMLQSAELLELNDEPISLRRALR